MVLAAVNASTATKRVYFALWPAAATRTRLDALGQRLQGHGNGRRMRSETLHLTLAFIGDVPVARLDLLREAAACVSAECLAQDGGAGFTLAIDRLGFWRHNKILWAGCQQAPLALLTLVGRLREQLAAVGLPLATGDFNAHVTLLRHVGMPPTAEQLAVAAPDAVIWPVHEFVLVESQLAPAGSQYTIIGRWPLATVQVKTTVIPAQDGIHADSRGQTTGFPRARDDDQ